MNQILLLCALLFAGAVFVNGQGCRDLQNDWQTCVNISVANHACDNSTFCYECQTDYENWQNCTCYKAVEGQNQCIPVCIAYSLCIAENGISNCAEAKTAYKDCVDGVKDYPNLFKAPTVGRARSLGNPLRI